MSQPALKEGDIVEIKGHGKLKLYGCKACGKLMALENLETDRTKPARWKKWNLDGTEHIDQQTRKQSYKRTIAVGKLFSQNYQSVRIEIQEEFPAEGKWQEQYAEVLAEVDQAIASERKKIVEAAIAK